ncbi:MAG TPA: sodium:solute symporter [Thermoanaerobaculia bacterium]
MRILDPLIIAAYVSTILGIGFWARTRQKTTRHYFLAGQQVPWWAISASIVATETSAISFVSVPGLAYSRGGDFTFLQLVLGYILGRVVITILFIPAYFRRSLLTVYQLLQSKFGMQVKSLAASLFIVMRTIADGVRLLLTSIVLATVIHSVFPNASSGTTIPISIVFMGVLMLLFTAVGGMEAVVWSEVLQLGIYLTGAATAAVLLIRGIPGGLQQALAIGEHAHKFRMFDFSFDLTRPYVFWAGVIGGCFLTASTHGTDQYMVQRYLCTDSPRKASVALLLSGVVVFLQFVGFLFIGVLLFCFYRPDLLPGYATGPPAAPFVSADQVFPDFIVNHVPTGLSGLIVAAILAAAVSPSVNSIAATALADLYQPLVRGKSDGHYLSVSRVLTVVAGIAQILVALSLIGQTGSAVNTALAVASLINGPILGVFLLSALQREGATAAFAGMLSGIAAVTAVWLWTPLAWPWYAVVGSLTTVAVGSTLARRATPVTAEATAE